jgi:hypothetical protein
MDRCDPDTTEARAAQTHETRALCMRAVSQLDREPLDMAGSSPRAQPIPMQVLLATAAGRLLGAPAVGEARVARRIDVMATA